jgi:tubulin-specific chaperone A
MAPPSQLSIATSSVQRLVKEEASYYKELQQQEARVEKLQASKEEDENAEYQLKQEASTCFLLTPALRRHRTNEKLRSELEGSHAATPHPVQQAHNSARFMEREARSCAIASTVLSHQEHAPNVPRS